MNDVKVATTFVILSSKQNLTLPHHFFFWLTDFFVNTVYYLLTHSFLIHICP